MGGEINSVNFRYEKIIISVLNVVLLKTALLFVIPLLVIIVVAVIIIIITIMFRLKS